MEMGFLTNYLRLGNTATMLKKKKGGVGGRVNDGHLGADDRLSEVGHEANKSGVPLVGDLGEGGASRRHEHLPDAILERSDRRVVHPQERLRATQKKKKQQNQQNQPKI